MSVETVMDYCAICGAEVDTPVDTLTAMTEAPGSIARALRHAPEDERQGWSPPEVATHLADTEVVTGWRLRQILAEKEPEVQPYDQDKWATALHYGERDTDLSLDAFATDRRANLEILRLLSDIEGSARTVIQSTDA